MSDSIFRKPLAEADLRDVKAEAVERLADGARKVGGTPNLANIERFVDPIVEKVNRDHDDLRRRGVDPLEKPKSLEGNRTTVGEFDFTTGQLSPTSNGQRILRERNAAKRMSLNMRALQHIVRRIVSEPELETPWKRLLQAAMYRALPPGHTAYACAGCDGAKVCVVRETALRAVAMKFMEAYGDPRPAILAAEKKERRG